MDGTPRPQGAGYDMGPYEKIILTGDIDDNGAVNVGDCILSLQICAGMTTPSIVYASNETTGDGKIGLEESIYLMNMVSGLTN